VIARRDRGAAVVWAVGLCAALLLVSHAVLLVVAAGATRQRAVGAADLAALAAAGPGGCPAADGIARANGGTLVSCRLSGGDAVVVVRVTSRIATPTGDVLAHEATARAGPP
jgi:secretion/DNA translocation related TadE-like protein